MNYADVLRRIAEGGGPPPEGPPPQSPTFVRMIVLDVIFDPNATDADAGRKNYWEYIGVSNMEYAGVLPRNTVVAKRVGEDSKPLFVFPFFPSHLSLPCKPGECVWVMLENPNASVVKSAFWFCRVAEPHTSDDVNHSHPGRAFEPSMAINAKEMHDNEKGGSDPGDQVWHELRNGPVLKVGKDRVTSPEGVILRGENEDVFETLITKSAAAMAMSYEAVPRFRKRPGDMVLEGSNNSLIVLGTDRSGPVVSYKPPKTTEEKLFFASVPGPAEGDSPSGAGSIDLVVGRGQVESTFGKQASTTSIRDAKEDKKGSEIKKELNKSFDVIKPAEGDPDFTNDRSRILLSQRTNVDANFGLTGYNARFKPTNVKDSPTGDAAVVIKTDKVRIIARSDVEIVVTGFKKNVENSPTGQPRKDEESDAGKWASIVVKSNGDIVFTPSDKGVIKLGGEDADLAVLCEKAVTGPKDESGVVTSTPIIDTMGGSQGTGVAGQGKFAKKVLLK